jgi:hypothetical protein
MASPPPPTDAAPALIELQVAELNELFDVMDPSPFGHRDLDPDALEFILSWAREHPRKAPLALKVHLGRLPGRADEETMLRDAVQGFFRDRAQLFRRNLRNLFRVGRTSLSIGLAFLAVAVAASDLIAMRSEGGLAEIVREGLVIVGWVALWRPLEIFLYDWWPILAQVRLAERLARMPVTISYTGGQDADAWLRDWPALGSSTSGKIQSR